MDDRPELPIGTQIRIYLPWWLASIVWPVTVFTWSQIGQPPRWVFLTVGPSCCINIVGAALMWRAERRLRDWRRSGRCLTCGYSLTGNVSGVCPECGTRAKK